MCAIIGALVWNHFGSDHILETIYQRSHQRGRDGRGVVRIGNHGIEYAYRESDRLVGTPNDLMLPPIRAKTSVALFNLRAEPTTEYVQNKTAKDQQPYTLGLWTIVHNGTIANDKELRTGELSTPIDSAAIVERLLFNKDESDSWNTFKRTVLELKGSFAILAAHHLEPDTIYAATNYRPIWCIETHTGLYFASSRDYFPPGYPPRMLPPYSISKFWRTGDVTHYSQVEVPRTRTPGPTRALVVCSGGLDSVVAATVAQRQLGYDVALLHFHYGSRVEEKETDAVAAVNMALGLGAAHYLRMTQYDPEDSPLMRKDDRIAGGEAGAEFAHEWVPARNLIMLAMATGYAEAKGFDKVILGNNLEEAGAYPDNEPEFIQRFNDLLPFAVADGKRVQVEMPVGNLMKHEIVALGHQVGAPMHLTWSCYRAGEKHCGTCGPCFMRRKAFEINNLPEVIEYALPLDENLRS